MNDRFRARITRRPNRGTGSQRRPEEKPVDLQNVDRPPQRVVTHDCASATDHWRAIGATDDLFLFVSFRERHSPSALNERIVAHARNKW